jgi:membrane protein
MRYSQRTGQQILHALSESQSSTFASVADKGHDWRAEVGASNSGCSVDLARAREPGRGREANTPEQIPPRGWKDILWRVLWSISADRILSTSGGEAFFALLAVFPAIAAIVSLYGLVDC